ncbi:MAG TPA: hydrolase [Phycisphaerae bacterium]|nr:hydrolase [Phycisphaerae bacterium]
MLNALRLDTDRAMLLVIDVQSGLLPAIVEHESVLAATRQLLRAARLFELPVLATEQYPKGIGPTDASVAELIQQTDAPVLEKSTFSACDDEPVREALRRIDRPQIVLCGIEAHVCVQQTALDLVSLGHQVYVCADAVGSRRMLDRDVSLQRMRQAGAIVTTSESVLFELCVECGTARFKELLELVKAADQGRA